MQRLFVVCLLLVLAFLPQEVFSQYYSVSGKVVDEDGRPLVGASLFVRETRLATITDEDGKYALDSLYEGTNALVCTHVGYKRYIEYLEVSSNLEWNIELLKFTYDLDQIMITANRLTEKEPYSYTTVTDEELEPNNLGQDLPHLLQYTPNIVVTSDAGNGIGYTGLRIRGSDPSRINVTINGIPLNDSESQSVFWVNMPDFASSISDVQVQRGVGTSTNGSGAFGGTVAINSHKISSDSYIEMNAGYGSFNTKKLNAKLGTGLLNSSFFIDGRFSIIKSDGFIDRSESDLQSFQISVGKISDNNTLRFDFISGEELTQQAWYGVPESKYQEDATALNNHYINNKGSLYLESEGPIELYNSDFLYETYNVQDSFNLFNAGSDTYNYYGYPQQVDFYQQDHFQLHWATTNNLDFESNVSLHYTRGLGYFEQFKFGQDLEDYALTNVRDTITNSNISDAHLVRRKWLDNHFFGGVANLKWNLTEKMDFHWGLAASQYLGDHYGTIVAWDIPATLDESKRYYDNTGNKFDGNTFVKLKYTSGKLSMFGDLQYRFVNYTIQGKDDDAVVHDITDQLNFFNPKIGATYAFNEKTQLYASAAVANREPYRNDYLSVPTGSLPTHESMIDYEIGLRTKGENWAGGINFYLMDYSDQLVITGELNDVGANLRTNVKDSYRRGIEAEIGWRPSESLTLYANTAVSQNKIAQFDEVIIDYVLGQETLIPHENTDLALSPDVVGALGIEYRPLEKMMIGLQNKYVGQQFLDNTSNENRSLDAYFVSNAIASYELELKYLDHLRINLQVNNLLNTRYASNGYTYSYLVDELITENYVYPQAGVNFLLGLSVKI